MPISLSAFSKDDMEKLNLQSFEDLGAVTPGLVVTPSGATAITDVIIRGVVSNGNAPTTGLYIDETSIAIRRMDQSGFAGSPHPDIFDLDRVEVLRGPQGTLYGANSLGGLVKYVTVGPDTHLFGAAAEAGIEDVSHGDMGWWARAAANVPLSDAAAFRLTGFYRRDPGYIDDPNHGDDINDGKTYGGRLSVLLKPTSKLRIRGSVLLENIRSNGTNMVDLDPVTFEPAYGSLKQVRVLNEPNDIDYRLYNTTIDYDFGPVALVSSTSYGTLDQKQVEDASSIYGALLTFFLGTPLGAGVDQRMTQRRFCRRPR